MKNRAPKKTTPLTPKQKVSIAYWYMVRGYPQEDLAAMYECNPGRVSETIKAIRAAVGHEDGA